MFFDSLIYYLDLFKSPMYLLFDSKRKVPSLFSSIISLGIILFLFIFFFQSDIFAKKNPISSVQSIATNHRPALNFDYGNMAVAIGLGDFANNIVYDPSIFSFTIYASAYTGSGDTIYEMNKTLGKCKEENFKNYGNAFAELGMQKYFCMDEGNFTLEGYWDETLTKYIDITLVRCNNGTSNNTCKSNEEIQEFFQDKYLNIYYTDNIIDVNNYENPIQTIYKNKYFLMDAKISKKITFYFKKVEFFNDDGIIFSNDQSKNSFLFGNFEVDYMSDNIDWIGTILLYSSSEIYTVTRRYQKIQEVIANLGGLANAMFILGYILTSLEKQFIYFKTMISRTYSLVKPKNQRTNAKIENVVNDERRFKQNNILENNQSIIMSEKTNSRIFPISQERSHENPENLKIKHFQKNNWKKKCVPRFFLKFFRRIRKKMTITFENYEKSQMNEQGPEKFTVSFFQFLKVKYKPSFMSFSPEEKILKDAMNLYRKEIDIINIVEKLQEIDKLKEILLDNEQNKMLQSMGKPSIMKKIHESTKKIEK